MPYWPHVTGGLSPLPLWEPTPVSDHLHNQRTKTGGGPFALTGKTPNPPPAGTILSRRARGFVESVFAPFGAKSDLT